MIDAFWRVVEGAVSDLCRWRWRSYDDYLRSWVWRSKRARARARFDGACAVCNSPRGLELHHRERSARWGWEEDADLTLLCSACHGKYHEHGLLDVAPGGGWRPTKRGRRALRR
jgi:5-methylcytosine-specific restriction endonuclease McrA